MNTIRPVLLLIVLGGIGYAVYARLNAKPDNPPPGIAENWDEGLQVEMPGEPSSTPAKRRTTDSAAGAPPSWNQTVPDTTAAAPRFPADAAAEVAGNKDLANDPTRGLPPIPADLSSPRNAATQPAPAFGSADSAAADYGAPPDIQTGAPDGAPIPGSPADSAAAGYDNRQFEIIMQAIQQELEQDHLTEALLQLTKVYEEPGLPPTQQQQVVSLLDQLAGTVIYSTRSIMLPPHEVKAGETLESIATELQVPAQLLAKINGIEDPNAIQPGERLKVVRGPFQAVVDMARQEMTLRVGGMYAGRFPIGIGTDSAPPEGSYAVTEKVADPTYHGNSRSIPGADPANPLGKRWIGLGDRFGIHGAPVANAVDLKRPDLPGSIALQPRDVEDAFDILSVGSRVIIRR